jgi:hypothetical protein
MRLKLSLRCGLSKVQGLDTHGPSLWLIAQSQIDNSKLWWIFTRDNIKLPPKRFARCGPKTILDCPKEQTKFASRLETSSNSWNPIAQFVRQTKELIYNSTRFKLSHYHSASPWWSQHESCLVQVEFTQRDMSPLVPLPTQKKRS